MCPVVPLQVTFILLDCHLLLFLEKYIYILIVKSSFDGVFLYLTNKSGLILGLLTDAHTHTPQNKPLSPSNKLFTY